jgi:hypothetical protein
MSIFSNIKSKINDSNPRHVFIAKGAFFSLAAFAVIYTVSFSGLFSTKYDATEADAEGNADFNPIAVINDFISPPPVLDKDAYDKKLAYIANNPEPVVIAPAEGDATADPVVIAPPPPQYIWPAKTVYPNVGALLPFNRIVAYYGNFYSTKMGVLGEYETDVMLKKLAAEVESWKAADPETPVIPAIHYIAITAQGSPGSDGKYRFRMPDDQIDHAVELAKQINGIVFLDLQVALSTVEIEIPLLEKYLKMPEVHLALDPEFSMKTGAKPGTVIGTLDAADINFAANYLAKLVKENNLPPKVLVIHRFTEKMVTNYKLIKPLPEVQIVMDMDGWGFGAKKINTYNTVIYDEPVQFTGFKLFYKNDLKPPSTRMLTPKEVLDLTPSPLYIQYQ